MDAALQALTVALFLSLVTNRIIQALVEPVKLKWPSLDLWWLIYVGWGLGGLLAWLANINLFTGVLPQLDPLAGRVLTAVVTGGGANLIADVVGYLKTGASQIIDVTPK
jgi:uncharacterized BrkB/YihY/UPF0761 family membrane protein